MIKAVIADDEEAVINTVRMLLQLGRAPVEIVGSAQNGPDAVKIIREHRPQIVFLDIRMPIMNGFQVMNAVSDEFPQMKFIIITAFESFEYAQRALRMGASDILLKPIDENQLYAAVRMAIGWSFTTNETVNEILAYIHDHYNENILVSDLAARYFTTPSSLSRLFKRHTGQGIIEYLHQTRIQYASQLLSAGNSSIQSVSEQAGYYNIANFYKYFKKYKGTTPVKYRKKGSDTKSSI